MSYIPNNAMPHAGHIEPAEEFEHEPQSRRARAREMVRDHPKTSVAAGAALIAGLAAAAALPFLAARDRKKTAAPSRKSSTATKRSPAKKSAVSRAATTKPAPAKKKPAAKRNRRAKAANGKSAVRTS